ncbi:KAP family P-loop NTPase fold protein [Burkholderia pseudomallei]|uniref:KAP family P-loop NTPase fold protein n=1 Tax=Burkholderia pseudomallei TaxID=28450 RepID=UPI00053711C9|nr:P-loop NTPase fold protein [Burkholderia pseudomallei]KAA8769430.1 NTPase KAP [Burkholderia pseudomallei]KGW56656.1 AAA ATPase domain protein [Burkholderia pseudomallei MSHR1357]KKC13272.1 AAA ATPase domain protein [Burkholderia pseudomallei MSHR1328]OMZ98876.1 NTPase KAP [Burkholderia pseudomallei]ONB89979.1 NTPase KAP [Burkholderia pseudomallei]
MWHDVETSTDLLNFSVVADTAAQLIRDSAGEPLSIGISGSWGVGKSSLVRMVGDSLKKGDGADEKYVFLDFNAWLYQGFDDARMALLQSVSDKLVKEAETRKTFLEKAKDFAKRVKWLRAAKLLAPVAQGVVMGGAIAGPVGAVVGAVGGLFKAEGMPSAEDLAKVKDAYSELQPELKDLLKDNEAASLPKEIAGLRNAFHEILEGMDVTLVVFVDDLDRCLPDTAISTLEAMRLLLFMPRTAFVIAADEQMIRGAVQAHFKGANLSDDLVTSYFDKLIQVPLRVPRLGITEVKAYLVLLFADLAERRGELAPEVRKEAQAKILDAVKKSWAGALTRKTLTEAFGQANGFTQRIDLADQLAPLLATADHIAGNPRLIKRFMNNLMIRETIAKAQGMTVGFEELVKLQLFERCASPAAFEFLVKAVGESEDGKPQFFADIEDAVAKGETYKVPDPSWDVKFIGDWLKLSPPLAGVDLRPLLYLSKDRGISLAAFDELSPEGRALLDAVLEAKTILDLLVKQLQALGETEAERVLTRLMRRARSEQWNTNSLNRCLHVTRAFPQLGSLFVGLLQEIPAAQRPAALLPNIRDEAWAKDLLVAWAADTNSPLQVRNALKAFQGRQ